MAVERKFVEDSLARYRVAEYLKQKLKRVGFSNVTIQRTPMVTRITVEVANPGKLIGKKGKSIKRLTDTIAKVFGMSDPQIAVIPVEKFELEPQLMAQQIAWRIEGNKPIRPTVHAALKKIMDAKALGCEIVVSGKIVAKGGKAKSLRVAAGYLPKAGDLTKLLKTANVVARPKYGAVNVQVTITPPGAFEIKGKEIELPKVFKYAETTPLTEEGKASEEKGKSRDITKS
jgi:small subunit ribosomal protein S3